MSLAAFDFTNRARPIVELGLGDSRVIAGTGRWDVARWGQPGATWAGVEPTWTDITCECRSAEVTLGRRRITERFVVGTAELVVDNVSGWADPARPPASPDAPLILRPGRSIRIGIEHATLGTCWKFRGVIDEVDPTYVPIDDDTVRISCVDALGDVNRAKLKPLGAPVGANEYASERVHRILDAAQWWPAKRDVWQTTTPLRATTLSGQVADLLGVAADSAGGAVFGDLDGDIAFRPRDWQTYTPTEAIDGTIGNVAPTDVCPTRWVRPFNRADIATRILVGRDGTAVVQVDDTAGQQLYGIEPFERLDLETANDPDLTVLANRYLAVRAAATAPRVRSVTVNAATNANALDLLTLIDVYQPSRYRCRLNIDRGLVFDAEHFATGVSHRLSPERWETDINLDLSATYAAAGGRWDQARWDRATWAQVV